MSFLRIAAALLLAPLSAAAAQQPVTPGTITVEPLPQDAGSAEARRQFAEAAGSALADAGFLVLPADNRGRYVARMVLSRRAEGSVAVDGTERGALGNVGNWGAGLSVALPSGKREMRSLVVSQLDIEILRRDEAQPVWRGRALTVRPQGTPRDTPAAVAGALAGAAMRAFPELAADVVSVL